MMQGVLAHASGPLSGFRSWTFDPLIVLGLAATAALYLWAVVRVRRRPARSRFPPGRVACFVSGLAVIAVALQSPIDTYSDRLLWMHMVQHLLLTMVAPPLLVLGTPITLALRASTPSLRARFLSPALHSRPARFLCGPVVGWSAFAVVLWASHFTGLYEEALGNPWIHRLEHVLYLVTAVLFWRPVVGLDPGPARISHPARILYVFLAMPLMALLGLAVSASSRVLYPHYVLTSGGAAAALSDQRMAGVLMWGTSMVLFLPALALILLQWKKRDEREAARLDARLDAGPDPRTDPRLDRAPMS